MIVELVGNAVLAFCFHGVGSGNVAKRQYSRRLTGEPVAGRCPCPNSRSQVAGSKTVARAEAAFAQDTGPDRRMAALSTDRTRLPRPFQGPIGLAAGLLRPVQMQFPGVALGGADGHPTDLNQGRNIRALECRP